MALFADALDQLLSESMAAERKRKFLKMAPALKKDVVQAETIREMYANPDNWITRKCIALIHLDDADNPTLLGAFREFIHKRTHARKLVRLEGPQLVQCEETVKGSWWLEPRLPTTPSFPEVSSMQSVPLEFDLALSELGVISKSTPIVVLRENGWTRRVLLAAQTQFICPQNHTIIWLPKNLDVLSGMSFENKIALKTKLENIA